MGHEKLCTSTFLQDWCKREAPQSRRKGQQSRRKGPQSRRKGPQRRRGGRCPTCSIAVHQINWCPRRIGRNKDNLIKKRKVCCVHPNIQKTVVGAKGKCCDDFSICF